MTDTLQRQALIRDLARRLETAGPDELSVVELVVKRLEHLRHRRSESSFDDALLTVRDDMSRERWARQRRHEAERDLAVSLPLKRRTPEARRDYIIAAAQTGAITPEVAREMIEAAERSDDDPAREWATESTVGTVCSDESLAIARTVTAERSDPYETVVVEADGGGKR